MKLWAAVAAVMLACGPASSRSVTAGSERLVTGEGAWLTYDRIPARWEHLFTGEVTGPYYLAFSNGYACRVDATTYTMLREGLRLTCVWRTPRGV